MNRVRLFDVRFGLLLVPLVAVGLASPPADRYDDGMDARIEAAGYAGSDTCEMCHEDQVRSLAKASHGKTSRTTWDGISGCESCHGPGQAHVDAGGDPELIRNLEAMSSQAVSETCLDCHEKGERRHWAHSAHSGRGLSCITCHSIHHEGEPPEALLAKGNEFDTCTSCHLQKKAAIFRSAHMPIREGSMNCSDCHNPHGSLGPSNLRQFSVNENCYECHAEKRSPKLWEHPPVREDCTYCHDPHGSVHPKMLNAKMPWLCQQCHDEARHPTEPWASSQEGFFFPTRRAHFNKACTNCHVNIHGSNHPSGVRFMR